MSKELWLKELSLFIVEANLQTWAAQGSQTISQSPGYTELDYPKGATPDQVDWYLKDQFTGYFQAPGTTTVYYHGLPAWVNQYGGRGMFPDSYKLAEQTFDFLREALMLVKPELPFRGPKEYVVGKNSYYFNLLSGGMEDAIWQEAIMHKGVRVFEQTGTAGIVVSKGANNQPIYPWNF